MTVILCTPTHIQKRVSEISLQSTTLSERREDQMGSLGSPGTQQTEVGTQDPLIPCRNFPLTQLLI